jgi:putative tryptophan/tyrosine transport system substrate-binding protein
MAMLGTVSLVLLAGPRGVPADAVPHLVLVLSHEAPPYAEAAGGFVSELRRLGVRHSEERIALRGDAAAGRARLGGLRRDRVGLVLALGSLACRSALERRDLPIVAGLIVSSTELGRAPNATGVELEIPLSTQLRFLRRMLPEPGTIGLLYDPAQNNGRAQRAREVARSLGLELDARPVQTASALPQALGELGSRIAVLWGLSDTVVFTPETAKQLLLFSFRNRIPLIGPSAPWAKAGALYALDWDYADLGRQCAAMAAQILKGRPPRSIPVEGPRRILHVVNTRTAAHMKLEIPDELLQSARQRY